MYRQRMQSLNVYCSANNLPKVREPERVGFCVCETQRKCFQPLAAGVSSGLNAQGLRVLGTKPRKGSCRFC